MVMRWRKMKLRKQKFFSDLNEQTSFTLLIYRIINLSKS